MQRCGVAFSGRSVVWCDMVVIRKSGDCDTNGSVMVSCSGKVLTED